MAKTREQMYEDKVEEENSLWRFAVEHTNETKYVTIDASDGMVAVQRVKHG